MTEDAYFQFARHTSVDNHVNCHVIKRDLNDFLFSTGFWFSMLLVTHEQTPGLVHNRLAKPLGAMFRGRGYSCHGYLAASPQAGGCGDVDYGYDAEV